VTKWCLCVRFHCFNERRFYKTLDKESRSVNEDCKTIQYYYTINNMSQKILLDKINIPGIKTYEVYRQNGVMLQ
jgi:thiol:disulfide interchange protein